LIIGSLSFASLGLVLFSVVVAAGGQLMLKHGMQLATARSHASGRSLPLAAITTPWIPLGLAVFAVSAMVWLVVLSRVPLSLAYPFNALSYLVILSTSALVLHEHVSPVTWAGTLLVVAGLIIVVFSQP
jgi:drug/metabolite transporter (DMT)-like permease